MPYNSGATKAMKAMQKEYGSNWQHVYYGLANKRSGKGLKGKHRGHLAANAAYAKGSHWGGKGGSSRKRTKRTYTSSRSRGRSLTVRTRGRANVSRRSGGAHVRVRVR